MLCLAVSLSCYYTSALDAVVSVDVYSPLVAGHAVEHPSIIDDIQSVIVISSAVESLYSTLSCVSSRTQNGAFRDDLPDFYI